MSTKKQTWVLSYDYPGYDTLVQPMVSIEMTIIEYDTNDVFSDSAKIYDIFASVREACFNAVREKVKSLLPFHKLNPDLMTFVEKPPGWVYKTEPTINFKICRTDETIPSLEKLGKKLEAIGKQMKEINE